MDRNYNRIYIRKETNMELKIVKIEGEFVVVELPNGIQKVCPLEIFPGEMTVGSWIRVRVVNIDKKEVCRKKYK